MKRNETRVTDDGSYSLFSSKFGEQYHSAFGAIQESEHIFIRAGLEKVLQGASHLSILEIGLGTGLNLLLTALAIRNSHVVVHYDGVEAYPLSEEELKTLNYPQLLHVEPFKFVQMHKNSEGQFSENFFYKIITEKFQEVSFPEAKYQLVYFDAFSPNVQPEMWSVEGFSKLFHTLSRGGVLVTYSCKGIVKRALKSAGFHLEKLPGPPGKREFLRAIKPVGKIQS